MKKKILAIGFVISILIGIVMVNSVSAGNNQSGKKSNPLPIVSESVSYVLLMAGGVSPAVIRRLKFRKSPKVLKEHSKLIKDEFFYSERTQCG